VGLDDVKYQTSGEIEKTLNDIVEVTETLKINLMQK